MMRAKYFPDYSGGFIGTEDGKIQICDFREGMGKKYGMKIADYLNKLNKPKSVDCPACKGGGCYEDENYYYCPHCWNTFRVD